MKNEIAAPFGLAMTNCSTKVFNAFVLGCPIYARLCRSGVFRGDEESNREPVAENGLGGPNPQKNFRDVVFSLLKEKPEGLDPFLV